MWFLTGQGAVTQLWHHRLKQHDVPVHLLYHRQNKEERKTFRFHTNQGQAWTYQTNVLPLCQAPEGIQSLLLCAKAFHVQAIFEQLKPSLSDYADIILCHNGLGTIEPIVTQLKPNQRLWFLSTTHGALRLSQQETQHTGVGSSVLGLCHGNQQRSSHDIQDLVQAGCIELVDDIEQRLWLKLAVNSVINPLTAIHHCRNGALSAQKWQMQIEHLCEEFCAVANSAGINLTIEAVLMVVSRTIEQTAENYSSMHQDVYFKRQTEIEFITGYLLEIAKLKDILIPTHTQVYQEFLAQFCQP
ncbi:ketopantoate reductase family protein [Algicola sagamiensis]|uniref:ketopantoate reductase family protein n=1 Tax=Algicola sagamiensis TaxID=163869 RepID=UPI000378BAFB|nr:2-dehydropantoate 2-reductase [Algicola sagamiensis]